MLTPPPRRRTKGSTRTPLLVLLTAALLPACAPPRIPQEIIFIPAPPEKPRLQPLLGFTGERDLNPATGLQVALLGKKERPRFSFKKPYAAVLNRGRLFVSDTGLRAVVVVDLRARSFTPLPGDANMGKLKMPINLAFDAEDNLYVTDTERQQVLVYRPDGSFSHPLGDGKSFKPGGIAIRGEQVFVTDLKGHQVLVLDRKSGKVLSRFGGPGSALDKENLLNFPTNLALDSAGNCYVSETLKGRVQVFSPTGKFLRAVGGLGLSIGKLVRPKGVALDSQDNLFVADAATEHVQIFNKEGKLLLFFGGNRGTPDSLYLPAGLSVSTDRDALDLLRPYVASGYTLQYLVVVVSQYGQRRISILGYIS